MNDGVSCWWCTYPFEGTTIHAPYKYDELRRRFDTVGHFCSWECAKSYLAKYSGPLAGERQQLLALMRQHASKKYVPTKPAPNRYLLQRFGGPLTIEQFRSGTSSEQLFMPNETHRIPVVISSNAVPAKKPGEEHTTGLVLKRPKPLSRAKSILETSLGITRRTTTLSTTPDPGQREQTQVRETIQGRMHEH